MQAGDGQLYGKGCERREKKWPPKRNTGMKRRKNGSKEEREKNRHKGSLSHTVKGRETRVQNGRERTGKRNDQKSGGETIRTTDGKKRKRIGEGPMGEMNSGTWHPPDLSKKGRAASIFS